jgi:hypothetical protein
MAYDEGMAEQPPPAREQRDNTPDEARLAAVLASAIAVLKAARDTQGQNFVEEFIALKAERDQAQKERGRLRADLVEAVAVIRGLYRQYDIEDPETTRSADVSRALRLLSKHAAIEVMGESAPKNSDSAPVAPERMAYQIVREALDSFRLLFEVNGMPQASAIEALAALERMNALPPPKSYADLTIQRDEAQEQSDRLFLLLKDRDRDCDGYRAERDQLRGDLAEALKDKARLDWLARVGPLLSGLRMVTWNGPGWVNRDGDQRYESFRAAIDAAMQADAQALRR